MVTSSRRSYLWVLARQKRLDAAVQNDLLAKVKAWVFKAEELIFVEHQANDGRWRGNLMNSTAERDYEWLTSTPRIALSARVMSTPGICAISCRTGITWTIRRTTKTW